ncbi:MAG: hypothetical protein R3D84_17865 [Paracoccaceae bacterium]
MGQAACTGGRIYIEHTMAHSAAGASEMDPFGAHPMCMPYLFSNGARGVTGWKTSLELGPKANNGKDVWLSCCAPKVAEAGQTAADAPSQPRQKLTEQKGRGKDQSDNQPDP